MSIKTIPVMDEEDAHARDMERASRALDDASKGLDALARERDEARRVAAQLAYVLDSVRGRYAALENEAICDALALVPEEWSEAGIGRDAQGGEK